MFYPYVFDFLGTADPRRAEKNRTTNHTNHTNRYEGLGMVHNSLKNQGLKGSTLEPQITQMAQIRSFFIREIRVTRG